MTDRNNPATTGADGTDEVSLLSWLRTLADQYLPRQPQRGHDPGSVGRSDLR